MTSQVKLLLLVLTITLGNVANASDSSKKEAVLNDKNIQANIDSIVTTYKAKCAPLSKSYVSFYQRQSMIQGVQSEDNFDVVIRCEDTAHNLGVPVYVEFLGHFSEVDSSVVTDAIVTSTPGFNFSNQNFLPMLPF